MDFDLIIFLFFFFNIGVYWKVEIKEKDGGAEAVTPPVKEQEEENKVELLTPAYNLPLPKEVAKEEITNEESLIGR